MFLGINSESLEQAKSSNRECGLSLIEKTTVGEGWHRCCELRTPQNLSMNRWQSPCDDRQQSQIFGAFVCMCVCKVNVLVRVVFIHWCYI